MGSSTRYILVAMVTWAFAWSLAVGLSACKTPEKIIVIRAGDPCLFVPPPVPKKVDYRQGQKDGGCLSVACLDSANADALGDTLDEAQRWQREAWIRCGPAQDGGK